MFEGRYMSNFMLPPESLVREILRAICVAIFNDHVYVLLPPIPKSRSDVLRHSPQNVVSTTQPGLQESKAYVTHESTKGTAYAS